MRYRSYTHIRSITCIWHGVLPLPVWAGMYCAVCLQVTLQTELGQLLDTTTAPVDKPADFTKFTPERHSSIVVYKTAFYSFYLPVRLAMIVAGFNSAEHIGVARDICIEMGEYFQVQVRPGYGSRYALPSFAEHSLNLFELPPSTCVF
jgi:polyprenyl synthetase